MNGYCYNCMYPIEAKAVLCPRCGKSPQVDVPLHQLRSGTLLKNRYLIGKSLGQGGFGITYIGRDMLLNKRVAVKEFYPNGYAYRDHEVTSVITITSSGLTFFSTAKRRFLMEAQTLARFAEESGIVSVQDFFEENNTAYIVMEYIDGITLKRFVEDKGIIPANPLIRVMSPLINALEKVHEQGIIHRDISPDNIMVLRNGSIKLLDFGAAREFGGDKSLSVMLKPGYAPEEQYRSKGQQGPWTDVYALCSSMYFCMTGVRPEEAPERVWEDNLKRPSDLGASISPAQESALMRGMSVRAVDRYQSMQELGKALYYASTQGAIEIKSKNQHNISSAHSNHVPPAKETGLEQPVFLPQQTPEKNAFRNKHERVSRSNGKTLRERRRWPLILGLLILIASGFSIVMIYERHERHPRENTSYTLTQPAQPVEFSEGAKESSPTESPQPTAVPADPYASFVQASKLFEDGKYAASMEHFIIAADAGYAEAMYCIGIMYENGLEVKQDYAQALKWYRRAADAGDADGMRETGNIFFYGRGTIQDYEQAMEWYRKAADAGDADATRKIGNMLFSGYDTEPDYTQALAWYYKAVNAGDLKAMCNIGNMYLHGYGVSQDYTKAMEWYRKAADAGEAAGMTCIAAMYYFGYGVEQDYAKTMEWYYKAVDAGDTDSMRTIGLMYKNGDGVAVDYSRAMEWFKKAAGAGNTIAMVNIGSMYENGEGVPVDYNQALEWYHKAADAKEPIGMIALAKLYTFGYGVTQDYGKALEWNLKAADAGNAEAMFSVGVMYEYGIGVAQDNDTAKEWYRKAADAGYEEAKARLGS